MRILWGFDLNISFLVVSCILMSEPIDYILKSEIGGVLSKAFAELYKVKPKFPVTHLAAWLKNYSQSISNEKSKQQVVQKRVGELEQMHQQLQKKQQEKAEKIAQQELKSQQSDHLFFDTIGKTEFLEDLLQKWLPNYIEKRYGLAGCYVGNLTHPIRPVASNNFQPGAQIDTESPKVIQYIGASDSQEKVMMMKILPSENGVTFECFNEPEPQPEEEPAEGEQPKPPKEPKKTYVFVPDVTKNEKIYYFKFPRLGSYASFPIKLKSVLLESGFDQGIADYKDFLKQKEEAEKQYNDKLNEIKAQYQEAKKKFDEFEVPEEDPTAEQVEEKKNLEAEASRIHENLVEFEKNAPQISEPKFNFVQKCYMLGCDTLGQDVQICQWTLDEIDKKLAHFRGQFEIKERDMLLKDILSFMEEEPKLETFELQYRQYEKKVMIESEQLAKQKNLKDKQLQFEIAATKVKKMDSFFEQSNTQKSMQTYFCYNTAKYKQILQIALMFLSYKAQDINLPRRNVIDFRKVKDHKFVEHFMKKLFEFDVRPQSAESCAEEYKINKLLERLEKIDLEQVIKYNGFIWALANQMKNYCWALILCKEAKKEAYQISVKSRDDRNAEIERYLQERSKVMNAAKAELPEENQATFSEQEWISNYIVENPEPQPLEVIELQQYHNID